MFFLPRGAILGEIQCVSPSHNLSVPSGGESPGGGGDDGGGDGSGGGGEGGGLAAVEVGGGEGDGGGGEGGGWLEDATVPVSRKPLPSPTTPTPLPRRWYGLLSVALGTHRCGQFSAVRLYVYLYDYF